MESVMSCPICQAEAPCPTCQAEATAAVEAVLSRFEASDRINPARLAARLRANTATTEERELAAELLLLPKPRHRRKLLGTQIRAELVAKFIKLAAREWGGPMKVIIAEAVKRFGLQRSQVFRIKREAEEAEKRRQAREVKILRQLSKNDDIKALTTGPAPQHFQR
jgi:hypothetical protein